MAGWQAYLGNTPLSAQDEMSSAWMNSVLSGLQDEVNQRIRAYSTIPGVITGLDCSINSKNIDVASGIGIVNGLLTRGTQGSPIAPAVSPYAITVAFSGTDGAATYYIYYDGDVTSETSALKKSSGVNTAFRDSTLPLGEVYWDGGTNLSALTDLRQFGTVPGFLCYHNAGAIATGVVARFPVWQNLCLRRPIIMVNVCGDGAGPTRIDFSTGVAGSTASIYSNQGHRPSIAHTDPDPTVTVAYPGDQNCNVTATPTSPKIIEIEVDAVNNNSTGLSVVIPFALT
jgi:hypothetical protein